MTEKRVFAHLQADLLEGQVLVGRRGRDTLVIERALLLPLRVFLYLHRRREFSHGRASGSLLLLLPKGRARGLPKRCGGCRGRAPLLRRRRGSKGLCRRRGSKGLRRRRGSKRLRRRGAEGRRPRRRGSKGIRRRGCDGSRLLAKGLLGRCAERGASESTSACFSNQKRSSESGFMFKRRRPSGLAHSRQKTA